jgi:hypothetical protein
MRTLVPALVLALAGAAAADVLHDNGPIITNPTGGTGAIAGLPISNADGFMIPGSTFTFSTTGVAATVATNTAAADDFDVPAGGWQLDTLTLFAFQTSQTTPTITSIQINLWTQTPYSEGSPGAPDPLPQPVLAEPLVLDAGPGTFVCHRESVSGTSTVRPVFSYTIPLTGLPNGGFLPEGHYWIQWSMQGASSPSANVFMPLVTPRTAVTGHNARLYNSVDGSPTGPRFWFEGREGYVEGQADGRAYELPFILTGVPGQQSCYANCDGSTVDPVLNVLDFNCFLNRFAAGESVANCDGSTVDPVLNVLDFNCFLNRFSAGCP